MSGVLHCDTSGIWPIWEHERNIQSNGLRLVFFTFNCLVFLYNTTCAKDWRNFQSKYSVLIYDRIQPEMATICVKLEKDYKFVNADAKK